VLRLRLRGGSDDSPAGKPVMNAHVDYTVDTVRTVAERIAPNHLKGGRYRFKAINAGDRSPRGANPLAIVDGSTVTVDLFLCRINSSRAEIAHSYRWNLAYSPRSNDIRARHAAR
jgi:hypothetical protein